MAKKELHKIFLVEDDEFIAQAITHYVQLNPDNEVEWFMKGRDALSSLYKKPKVAIVDYGLPDFKGDALIKEIRAIDPSIGIIVVSAQDDMQVAVDLLKLNIHDYIIKNKDLQNRLWVSLNGLFEKLALREEVVELKERIARHEEDKVQLIGNSPGIEKIKQDIDKLRDTTVTVSIYGETGSGKEEVAKSVHKASNRNKKPFVPINLAAIPYSLAESKLFGHEKGAFTGAIAQYKGLFEQANGGTVFLDELQDLDIKLQAKLLRVLQEGEVQRVGGTKTIAVDVRYITAANVDLRNLVRSNKFREDLYYRLLGYQINIPPLRERKEDIPLLVQAFLKRYAVDHEGSQKRFSEKAMDHLLGYDYPGNVRELKAMVENACLMASGNVVGKNNIFFRGAIKSGGGVFDEFKGLKDFQSQAIEYFMGKFKGNVKKTATRLGIGTTKIYDFLREQKQSQ